MFALDEEFKMNESKPDPMKVLDMTKHCGNHDGTMQTRDFTRYTKRDILYGNKAHSKTPIAPLVSTDRQGQNW